MTRTLRPNAGAPEHLRFGKRLIAGLETDPRARALIPGVTKAQEGLGEAVAEVEELGDVAYAARLNLNYATLALLQEVRETATAAGSVVIAGGRLRVVLFPPDGAMAMHGLRGRRLAERVEVALHALGDSSEPGMVELRARHGALLQAAYDRYLAALVAREAAVAAVKAARRRVVLLKQEHVDAVVRTAGQLTALFPRQRRLIVVIWPPWAKRRRPARADGDVDLDGLDDLDDPDAFGAEGEVGAGTGAGPVPGGGSSPPPPPPDPLRVVA